MSMDTSPHPATKTNVRVKTRYYYQAPGKYRVIFWNDDVTTFEFVINALIEVFNYPPADAVLKANEVDQLGSAPVGTYIKTIAETKRNEVIRMAREQNYPLKVTLRALS